MDPRNVQGRVTLHTIERYQSYAITFKLGIMDWG